MPAAKLIQKIYNRLPVSFHLENFKSISTTERRKKQNVYINIKGVNARKTKFTSSPTSDISERTSLTSTDSDKFIGISIYLKKSIDKNITMSSRCSILKIKKLLTFLTKITRIMLLIDKKKLIKKLPISKYWMTIHFSLIKLISWRAILKTRRNYTKYKM